jgi:hypothetical protein
LKGIQALRNTFTTTGVEEYSEKVNSVNKSIIELKGKTNVLTRTVEETNETVTDFKTQVYKDISQLDEDTQADIKKAVEDMGISVDEKLVSYSTTTEMNSAITQKAGEITAEISETYTTKIETDEITEEVSKLSTSVSLTAEGLESKVDANGIISAINQSAEEVSINADKINLSGYITASSLASGGTTNIDGSRITSGTISGVTLKSTASDSQYVEITNGCIQGGRSNGVGGQIFFGHRVYDSSTGSYHRCIHLYSDYIYLEGAKIWFVHKNGTTVIPDNIS